MWSCQLDTEEKLFTEKFQIINAAGIIEIKVTVLQSLTKSWRYEMIDNGVKPLDPILMENFIGIGSGSPELTDRFQHH